VQGGYIAGLGYVIPSCITELSVFLVFCLAIKLDIMAQNRPSYLN
jgi:hypothetical protein